MLSVTGNRVWFMGRSVVPGCSRWSGAFGSASFSHNGQGRVGKADYPARRNVSLPVSVGCIRVEGLQPDSQLTGHLRPNGAILCAEALRLSGCPDRIAASSQFRLPYRPDNPVWASFFCEVASGYVPSAYCPPLCLDIPLCVPTLAIVKSIGSARSAAPFGTVSHPSA